MFESDKPHIDNSRCDRCAVRDRTVCAVAHLAAENELARVSRTRRVPAGETILAENAEASIVGNVLAGVLRMTKTLPDGREQIVGLINPGEFFGRPYSETVEFAYEAATDVELCVMDRRSFEAVVARNPELEHELLLTTLDDLAFARERMLLLGCQNTLERVATYLLVMLEHREQLFADVALQEHKRVAVSAITRRDLASYLSTTIETISRHIHHLSRIGVIRIIDSSRFEVLAYEMLLALSGLAREDLRLFRKAPLFGRGPRLVALNGIIQSRQTPVLTSVKTRSSRIGHF